MSILWHFLSIRSFLGRKINSAIIRINKPYSRVPKPNNLRRLMLINLNLIRYLVIALHNKKYLMRSEMLWEVPWMVSVYASSLTGKLMQGKLSLWREALPLTQWVLSLDLSAWSLKHSRNTVSKAGRMSSWWWVASKFTLKLWEICSIRLMKSRK